VLVLTVLLGLPSFRREQSNQEKLTDRFCTLGRFVAQPKMRSFSILIFSYAVVMYMENIIPILQLEEFVETGRGSRSLIGAAILCSTMTEIFIFYFG